MTEANDFAEAFAGAEGGDLPPDALARMDARIQELLNLERYITETEELVKAAKLRANEIKQKELPDVMAELRVDEVVRDGYKLKIGSFVSGSLPNADRDPEGHWRAVEYLKTLPGGEDLLRTTVSLEFGKGQNNVAQAIIEDLRERYGVEPSEKYGVPHMTLQAYARQRLENTEPIDTDILGLYCGRAVKVQPVKSKKDGRK